MRQLVSLAELQAFGEALGRDLPPHAVVWLEGDMGAGKTTLVQAIVRGLGVTTRPTSPTYGLVHRYGEENSPVFHVDCYRLKAPAEAAEIDWEELQTGRTLLIEWPGRAGAWAPPASTRLRLDHDRDDDGKRWLEVAS